MAKHPDIVTKLSNLSKAKLILSPNIYDIVTSMNSLISVLLNAQKFDQAELILREILDFIKKHKSPKDYEIGSTLCIIASLQKL